MNEIQSSNIFDFDGNSWVNFGLFLFQFGGWGIMIGFEIDFPKWSSILLRLPHTNLRV